MKLDFSDKFIQELKICAPAYAESVIALSNKNSKKFRSIANDLIKIVARTHPNDWLSRLINGYIYFVTDVARSQILYESTGSYPNSSQKNILEDVYLNQELMQNYHWGMFATFFCWQHHLDLIIGFQERFLNKFDKRGPKKLIELGCGSGIWSFKALSAWSDTKAELVDISPFSVAETTLTANTLGLGDRVKVQQADITKFSPEKTTDAIISAFVAAHLDNPKAYFSKISSMLKPGGFAYVTVALNAGEIDHIYEFSYESEPILLAEEAGLTLTDAQLTRPVNTEFKRKTPRSFAMILQRLKS